MRSSLLLSLALLASCAAHGKHNVPVSAQRPTLSSDTATTVEGTVELEMGGAWDPHDSFDTPSSLKYGAGPSTEVFVNWSPFQELSMRGGDERGIGDVGVGFRHRFRERTESDPSLALQAAVKLPTADEDDGLGTGEFDFSVAGIGTRAFGEYVVTGYYGVDVLGDPSGGSDLAHNLALASTLPMLGRFGAFGELAGILIPEQDSEQGFTTLGLTYNPDAALVFDVAVVVGLTDDAPDFQLLFGFTHNFGSSNERP